MPESYLIMLEPTVHEDDAQIIEAATKHTVELCALISNGKPFDKAQIPFAEYLQSGIGNSLFYIFYIGTKKFYAADKCIKCGVCVNICLLNDIKS